MIVHLVDGTYELFRHFYGQRRFNKGKDRPFGAVAGVLHTVLEMIEGGATHIGVATDHVIESFRNDLWPGYKTGEGIERALLAQFHPLEEALAAMGVAVWPMVEFEADDALASAARIAARTSGWSKSASGRRQGSGAVRPGQPRGAGGPARQGDSGRGRRCAEKFGVAPALIPDFLALVGDAADGYPGIAGIGKVGGRADTQSLWADRGVSGKRAGEGARASAAVQAAGDAQDRRPVVSRRGRDPLARADRPICSVEDSAGGQNG